MPNAYNQKIANRGEAAAGILGDAAVKAIAIEEGTPENTLTEIAQKAQEAKAADTEQRTKQAESKKRNDALTKEYQNTRKEYTIFRQRRTSILDQFQDPSQSKLLGDLTADYTTKTQVTRTDKEGQGVVALVESEAMDDRLREIVSAVSVVLEAPDLVAAFTKVTYGQDKLDALLTRAKEHQAESKAIDKLRAETDAATKREHEAVDRVNALWKTYGPSLRRAAEKSPAIKALLKNT